MDWDFQKRSLAGDNDAASKSRIIIEGDHTITPFEVFVREVLQNSRDAALNGGKVSVKFKLRTIGSPGQRSNFLEALGWPKLKARVEASNRIRISRDEPPEFADPSALEHGALRVLEICETGTIGLVGPEAVLSEQDERRMPGEPPKAYIALARDDARREKQGLGSGGTYGLGKAVLWAASQIQTVVFFSRLAIPYQGKFHRAAAQARLGPHFLGNIPYRGLGYGGHLTDWCHPLVEQQALQMATRMGVSRRENPEDVGTTILIPFWAEPNNDDDELPTHVKIAKYAARYFWPAIVDNKLEVIAEDSDGEEEDAADHLTHFQPFIDLYQRLKKQELGKNDVKPEAIHFAVPPGPPPLRGNPSQTFVTAGMAFAVRDDEVREDFNRKVACIRGQGMVVGYAKMTGNTLVRPFVGIALAGRAADSSDRGVRGDVLLGFSEYVTHTRWDERSPSLSRYWTAARPVVREILQKMRDYFERNSRVEQAATGDAMTALEQGLRFPGPGKTGGPPPPPPPGQPLLRLQSFTREDSRYSFEVRARFAAANNAAAIDIWIEPGMETGNATKVDRFPLKDIHTVPTGLRIETLENGKLRVSVPTFQSDTQVRITGSTEEIAAEVFAISEGLFKAALSTEAVAQDSALTVEEEYA